VTDPGALVRSAWAVWLITWWAAAFWSNRTVGRPAISQQLLFRAFVIAGGALLFGMNGGGHLAGSRWWNPGLVVAAPFIAATIAGFALTWWARLTIGKLWSSGVTRKAEHRVVDTGPYGLVRHPIYSGLILSAFATACVPLTPMTLTGAALISFGFFLKARLEEQFLRAELGPGAYGAYARRVPMLVPFVKM
jgi:protein-S-isoprenylcysteine O-methyltransferase Ste14